MEDDGLECKMVVVAGPKDIVLIGRAAGKLTGKAVGYIQTARGQFDPILQRSEINTVCDTFASYFVFVFKCIPSIWAFLLVLPLMEQSGRMRMYEPWPNRCTRSSKKTMAQLEAIRHEMRTGLSILNPGPMTRQVMDSAAPGLLNPVEIKETGDCAVV